MPNTEWRIKVVQFLGVFCYGCSRIPKKTLLFCVKARLVSPRERSYAVSCTRRKINKQNCQHPLQRESLGQLLEQHVYEDSRLPPPKIG